MSVGQDRLLTRHARRRPGIHDFEIANTLVDGRANPDFGE